jgi:hypothetical protein
MERLTVGQPRGGEGITGGGVITGMDSFIHLIHKIFYLNHEYFLTLNPDLVD